MNLYNLLKTSKVDNIGFDTVYLEKPVSNIIDFDWTKILSAPPKNSDDLTIKELQLISKETKKRTKQDVEFVHRIDQDIDTPFELLLNQYNLTYPKNYISLFYDIARPILLNIKGIWNRPRPNQLAKFYNIDIDLIITDTIHTASYPSGHTVYSSLVANILKNLYPQIQQKKLDRIVLETARARVIQGAHYPTDNKGSLILSEILFNKLHPKLRKYYDEKI